MLKVLIADDEPIVREGMRVFNWDELNCALVGEAEDGQEGLEQLRSLKPDLVITDIKMPGMDGLKFAEEAKKISPDLEFIILTGYADFSYAQQALKAGVSDFLLKPIEFQELKAAISKISQRIAQYRREQSVSRKMAEKLKNLLPLLREQIIADLLDGSVSIDSEQITTCEFPERKYVVVSVQADDNRENIKELALFGLLKEAFDLAGREYYLSREDNKIYCVMGFRPGMENEACETETVQCFRALLEKIRSRYQFGFSAGISRTGKDLFSLGQLRSQSSKALSQRFIMGGNLILPYSDIQEMKSTPSTNLGSYKKDLHTALLENNDPLFTECIRKITAELLRAYPSSTESVKMALLHIIFGAINFVSESSSPGEIDYPAIHSLMRCEDLNLFLHQTEQFLHRLMESSHRETECLHSGVTQKILKYIEENYKKDLSLEYLSSQLNYSASYLSRLIKKDCGKNFMDILADFRMEKAKDILKNTDETVSRISGLVGYNDISYFIQVFKKHVGVTPNDYRQTITQ